MISAKWEVDQEKPITLASELDLDINLYVADVITGNYILTSVVFVSNDIGYVGLYTFSAEGDYIMKLVDLNNNISDIYLHVTVETISISNKLKQLLTIKKFIGLK